MSLEENVTGIINVQNVFGTVYDSSINAQVIDVTNVNGCIGLFTVRGYSETYVAEQLFIRDASIIDLRNYDLIQDNSIISIDNQLANNSALDVVRDASITILRAYDSIQDTSINNLGIYDSIQDVSILDLYSQLGNIDHSTIDASIVILRDYNGIQDVSILDLYTQLGNISTGFDASTDYGTYEPRTGTVDFDYVGDLVSKVTTVNDVGTKEVDFTYTNGEVSQIDISTYGTVNKTITFTKNGTGQITQINIV